MFVGEEGRKMARSWNLHDVAILVSLFACLFLIREFSFTN